MPNEQTQYLNDIRAKVDELEAFARRFYPTDKTLEFLIQDNIHRIRGGTNNLEELLDRL